MLIISVWSLVLGWGLLFEVLVWVSVGIIFVCLIFVMVGFYVRIWRLEGFIVSVCLVVLD